VSENKPVYFTGIKHNRLTTEFMLRPVGDLVEINGVQFTAEDAEKIAAVILTWTFPVLSRIERSSDHAPFAPAT
jgi:hypothetical protein